jgi:hypothetical protein
MDANPPADHSSPPAPLVRSPVSLWFRLAGLFGALFCVTAVAWAAAGVGDQRHPMKAWLGRHGTSLIVFESLAVLVTTLLGMLLPEKERLPLEGDRTQGSRLPTRVDPSDSRFE